ncbi:mechanosensitive ion channel family protein [Segnochrobactrum spirostomi]|nr:mechanosensitive ion channel domain-containing protein [Segnochrobactrum spirostomi]
MLIRLVLSVILGSVAAAWTAPVFAADATSDLLEPLDRSSPSATYQSFLRASDDLQALFKGYEAAKSVKEALVLRSAATRTRRLLDLGNVPPAARARTGNAAIAYLSDILVRLPLVDPASIPGAPGRDWGKLPDKWRIPGTEIEIARQTTGPQAGDYLFTADTIENLKTYYAEIASRSPLRPALFPNFNEIQANFTGPLIPDSWVRAVPGPLRSIVLDTPIWKTLVIVAAIAVTFVLASLWGSFASRRAGAAGHVGRLVWRISVPAVLFLLFTAAETLVIIQVVPSGRLAVGESIVASIIHYAVGAWAAWIGCFLIVEAIIASPKIPDNSYDAHLLRLAARLAALLSVGAILVYGANDIGIPALGLVAGLGVGGIAVALASQSTIENLFGGLSIFADRPFRIGDSISFGSGAGTVEAIGPRSSRIRASDGALITVPNSDLAKMHITNGSARDKFHFRQTLALRADTRVEALNALLTDLRGLLETEEAIEKCPGSPRVSIVGLAGGTIQIQMSGGIPGVDSTTFGLIQEGLILRTLARIEAAGLHLAVPPPVVPATA